VALSVAMFVAGLGCQPAITAGVEALTRVVPDRARGEALGWHGSAMTGGSAMGAPLAGLVIDARGGSAAFLGAAVLAVVIAVTGIVVMRARR
jgi:predicted MFS family arabinose efflux permease